MRADLSLPKGRLFAEPEDYRRPHSSWCVRDELGRKVVPYLSMADARAIVLGRRALERLEELEPDGEVTSEWRSPPPAFCSYCGEEVAPTDSTVTYAEGDVMHASCQARWDEKEEARDRT